MWTPIPSTSPLPPLSPFPPSTRRLSLHQEPRGDVYKLTKKTNLTGEFEGLTISFSAPSTIPSDSEDEVMVRTVKGRGNDGGRDGLFEKVSLLLFVLIYLISLFLFLLIFPFSSLHNENNDNDTCNNNENNNNSSSNTHKQDIYT